MGVKDDSSKMRIEESNELDFSISGEIRTCDEESDLDISRKREQEERLQKRIDQK